MKVVRCKDVDLIKSILIQPGIWEHCTDDSAPSQEDFTPIEHPLAFHIVPYEEDTPLGVFFIHQNNAILWEIHVSLLPICRGKDAERAAKLAIQWVFDNTPCLKLMTWIPTSNAHAVCLAANIGMVQEGVNRNSFKKNDHIYDMVLFGIAKRSESCQKS